MAHPIGTRDLLIKGGRIIDPSQGLDAVGDVLLRNGLVEACGGSLGTPDGAEVIELRASWWRPVSSTCTSICASRGVRTLKRWRLVRTVPSPAA